MLPEALDADTVEGLALGTIVVLGIAALLVLRFVAKAVVRLVLVAVLVVVGLGLWTQRADLNDCIERARSTEVAGRVTCRFSGAEVQVRGD
jgi:hypothetical protein